MSRNRKNVDKHTDAATVEHNIVVYMRKWRCGRNSPLNASAIGNAGFPDYQFKNPQGAALAVARVLRSLVDRGVLRPHLGGHGYYLAELA